jgi:hypothetical protein
MRAHENDRIGDGRADSPAFEGKVEEFGGTRYLEPLTPLVADDRARDEHLTLARADGSPGTPNEHQPESGNVASPIELRGQLSAERRIPDDIPPPRTRMLDAQPSMHHGSGAGQRLVDRRDCRTRRRNMV